MATTVIGARVARPARFWTSTNGQKVIMAVTGCILFLFVIAHLLGNLQVYAGPAQLNAYGRFLHSVPELLWFARAILLVSVVLHIWAAIVLGTRKVQARPVGYASKRNVSSSYASRTMYWSGPILLVFVVYHLLNLTAGVSHPGGKFIDADVYHNVVTGFQVWYISASYIFSMILLGFHLRHGFWSMFQSVGINHPRHTPILKKTALALAWIISLGYISIPVSVLLGVLK
jgi:succinate dehydrogenase / fumarate reductase cytochrome b subunit